MMERFLFPGQMEIHSCYTQSLVHSLASTQLPINYYEWTMLRNLSQIYYCPIRCIPSLFLIACPVHRIKRVCSNISQARKNSVADIRHIT